MGGVEEEDLVVYGDVERERAGAVFVTEVLDQFERFGVEALVLCEGFDSWSPFDDAFGDCGRYDAREDADCVFKVGRVDLGIPAVFSGRHCGFCSASMRCYVVYC